MEYVRSVVVLLSERCERQQQHTRERDTTNIIKHKTKKTKTTREQFKKRALFRALCFFASSKSRNVSCALFVYMRIYVRSSSSSVLRRRIRSICNTKTYTLEKALLYGTKRASRAWNTKTRSEILSMRADVLNARTTGAV